MTDYSDLAYSLAGVRRTNPYDRRRAFAQSMQRAGTDFSPVDHPLQGAARLAQALVGGWMSGRADQDEAEAVKKRETSLAAAMAEPDPKKRISMLGAIDPDLGAKLSGSLAVEQAKLGQQQEGLQTAATKFGGSFGLPAASPPGAPTQLGVNQGAAPPGGPAGFANNVGNIRATNINWQDKGQPHNGFETFGTPQAGANAMAKNLGAYVQANPGMTVADAIKKWAPPNENNTAAYIRGLAESTGINPGMPLGEALKDPMIAATLMDGIARIEKGGLPQGFTADTFIAAAGGAPPQVAQGSADASGSPMPPPGMPPAPQPGAVNGPTMVAPTIPDVPRPQPTQRQLAQYQQRLASGEFGTDPREAPSRARAALDAELDRDWAVQRDRAKMQFGQETTLYNEQRKLENEKNNPKFTEDANKAHAYAIRLGPAIQDLEGIINRGELPGTLSRGVVGLPLLGNTLAGPQGERFDQTARDIINAILRRQSGATITKEEFANAYQQYIPQPGESPGTTQQKMANLRRELKAMADAAGRTPDVYGMSGSRGAAIPPEPTPTPVGAAPTPGAVEGGYRFKGGNPADQRNWERVQ